MSDASLNTAAVATPQTSELPRETFCTEETRWGYIIRTAGEAGHGMIVTQSLSLLAGAALLAAALGMWLVPGMMFNSDAIIMRLFATIVFISISTLLLWYASRGTISEIQIDNARGEIREVIRNHTGKMSMVASYSFESIGRVGLEPAGEDAAALVLRYRNSSDTVQVAVGQHDALSPLCDRINHDVIMGASALAKRKAEIAALKMAA